ncbi:hypothetical protein [Luedemannella helvata]|uniref:Uncharacterized protein n=1 Tax=Luedemannella helvata TaxID=349315 RepID=A0ABN2L8M4_9ACTN
MTHTKEFKIVVALDFGTYGSGFSWSTVPELDRPDSTIYHSAFSGAPANYRKNLTAVLLNADGTLRSWGFPARDDWKHAAAAGNPANLGYAQRFKMSIRPEPEFEDVPEYAGSLADVGRSKLLPLIVHVLRMLREAVLEQIAAASVQAGGQTIGYKPDDIRWCITVPAIWEEHEKALMRQAAMEAGIPGDEDRLIIAIEPEAAAVFCAFHQSISLTHDQRSQINLGIVGNRFMVVDCGGGTVDITAYKVGAVDGDRQGLTEIGLPGGGKLGSEYVTLAFRKVMADWFGAKAMAAIAAKHPEGVLAMETEWDRWKVDFASRETSSGEIVIDQDRFVNVPHEIMMNLGWHAKRRLKKASPTGSRIKMTAADSQALFDPIVHGILEKIQQQLDEMIRHDGQNPGRERILLVGGFARSEYLKAKITKRFGDRVDVVVPLDPAIAVLAGAVRFARDPSVIWARRSKYTYGFALNQPFEPGVDNAARLERDEDKEARCTRFAIAVQRGETVAVGSQTPPVMVVPMSSAHENISLDIYASTTASPRYPDDPGCWQLGSVKVPLKETVGWSREKRKVAVSFVVGKTTIEVVATDLHTGKRHKGTVTFEEQYPE